MMRAHAAQASERRNHWSFTDVARRASVALGSGWAFFVACAIVVVWAALGPWLGYSDAWQLVINTGTTIITFLMVFLIQNTQNRDSRALHLKLDELIRTTTAARDTLIDLENCSDQEVDEIARQFERLKEKRSKAAAAAGESRSH
jgi:low affinity Fe/Cu permease